MQIVKKGQLSPWRDALVRKHCLTSSFGRIMKLKNGFLNKMKGATVTNNRSRIARHCPTSKQKPFCHGEKWKWNLNITTGIVIRDCQPERNYR
jgi:CDGSH-type Zn-finger protein